MARRHHLETRFGRILDPTADKVFILGTMASFAAKGIYSYWFLVPIFIREIAVTFCRMVWLRQGQAIGAERAGKLKLSFQVASVFFSFLYLGAPNGVTFTLNHLFISLALILTLISGFFFFQHHKKLLKEARFARSVAILGVGHLLPFPGTYGSLLGLVIVLAVSYDALLHFILLVLFIVLAWVLIPRMRLEPEEDPLEVVIDEVCGILLAFWTIPLDWRSLLLGFFLFRFFDVVKVFPIGWLEKRKGVRGIVLDDLGAGIYTWLLLKILLR